MSWSSSSDSNTAPTADLGSSIAREAFSVAGVDAHAGSVASVDAHAGWVASVSVFGVEVRPASVALVLRVEGQAGSVALCLPILKGARA
jgi:hypothetical protein